LIKELNTGRSSHETNECVDDGEEREKGKEREERAEKSCKLGDKPEGEPGTIGHAGAGLGVAENSMVGSGGRITGRTWATGIGGGAVCLRLGVVVFFHDNPHRCSPVDGLQQGYPIALLPNFQRCHCPTRLQFKQATIAVCWSIVGLSSFSLRKHNERVHATLVSTVRRIPAKQCSYGFLFPSVLNPTSCPWTALNTAG